jgi:hypothetical protein
VHEFNAAGDKLEVLDKFVASINSYTGLLKSRTDFKRIGALHEAIGPEWWAFCRWDAGRQCLAYLPRYTINERLNQEFHLHLKRHGK